MNQFNIVTPSKFPVYLVVGGDGLIGKSLIAGLRAITPNVYSTSRRKGINDSHVISYDLMMNPSNIFMDEEIRRLVSLGRFVVFICAAVTKIADCEEDSIGSRLINVTNTVALGKKMMQAGAEVVFLSSNAIFDGEKPFPTEVSLPAPKTNYGCHKVDAENGLMTVNRSMANPPSLMIARLTKVVNRGNKLIDGWIAALKSGQRVHAFRDSFLSPISLDYTIRNLIDISKNGCPGIYHISGSQDLSYYDFACLLAMALGVRSDLVSPISVSSSIPHLKNKYSALGVTTASRAIGFSTQKPKDALDKLLHCGLAG